MPCGRQALLIADDVELNRFILAQAFSEEYDIIEAENGQEAWEKFLRYRPRIAAVLLDIVMPVMDGFGMLEEMARHHMTENVPVFLVTSETGDEQLGRGFQLGVVDIIVKPFNPSFIRRRLGNILELYRHRLHLQEVVAAQEEKLRQTNSSIIDTLSTAIEFRDCESGEHVRRIRGVTAVLLQRIAEENPEYHLTEGQIALISDAAAMHDVGKISIPDHILNKPGRLTAEEFTVMKTHAVKGCDLLDSVEYLRDSEIYTYCYDICRHHHERWDGGGYPDGLKGDEITIWSQAVSLADVYDALVSRRIYKPPYTHAEAVEMILGGECGAFNPKMLTCFAEAADDIHAIFYAQTI
ncbi:response regulator [Oscillospiraceae bacterium NSJ-54]|uniref:Stage 0 sporulation protein A homolog n=1 Tax=Zongyangia hominis TaxID=2763677 RepID=A0A926ECL8_9FIRM|nr:response regulator [Zongyangia hominis]